MSTVLIGVGVDVGLLFLIAALHRIDNWLWENPDE